MFGFRKPKKKRTPTVRYPFLTKLDAMIDEERFDIVEPTLKRYLKNPALPVAERSVVYQLMGRMYYVRGAFTIARRHYELSIELNSRNVEALYQLSLLLSLEYEVEESMHYIKKALAQEPESGDFLLHYAWCLSSSGEVEKSLAVYERLTNAGVMDDESIVDHAMALVLVKRFDEAQVMIYKAMEKYPESYALEDALLTIEEIRQEFAENRRDLYRDIIPQLTYAPKIYGFALVRLVEDMTVRSFTPEEVELAAGVLLCLNQRQVPIKNPSVIAAVCELVIANIAAPHKELPRRMARSYGVSYYGVRTWFRAVQNMLKTEIERITEELNTIYETRFDALSPDDDDLLR